MTRVSRHVAVTLIILLGVAGAFAAHAMDEASQADGSVHAVPLSPAPPIERATHGAFRSAGDTDADRGRVAQTLQAIIGRALHDRLGPGHRLELSDIEYLRLVRGTAEARVWGLLFDRQEAPSMLRIDLQLDRDDLSVVRMELQAYAPNGIDARRTAALSGDPADPIRIGTQSRVAGR